MPDYLSPLVNAPTARYASLREAVTSGSPPTLPNCSEINCDPAEIIAFMKGAPIHTHIITAQGHAKVNATDKHG